MSAKKIIFIKATLYHMNYYMKAACGAHTSRSEEPWMKKKEMRIVATTTKDGKKLHNKRKSKRQIPMNTK
jgi:hypothetical protein